MKTMYPSGHHHNDFVATHVSVRFEHSVCCASLMTSYIYTQIHPLPLHKLTKKAYELLL